MNRRHILLKEDDRKWQTKGDPNSWGYIQRPLMAYPPLHPTYSVPPGHLYAPWVHPSYQPQGAQMWGHPGFQAWHPPLEMWHWKTYPGVIIYRLNLSVLLSYICCSSFQMILLLIEEDVKRLICYYVSGSSRCMGLPGDSPIWV